MAPMHKRVVIITFFLAVILLLIRYLLYSETLTIASSIYTHTTGAPVIVTVYYEALCIDSKHFITKQLVPTYKRAKPLMDVQLIPYGKAQTFSNEDGTYRFDCQHGPVECQANIYHSCAIETIEDVQLRLDMIACMIQDNRIPRDSMERCGKRLNIEKMDHIQKCYDSNYGTNLLKLNGDSTNSLRPQVKFIPTITLDGLQRRQPAILKNLLAEVCKIVGNTKQTEKYCKEL